jgi:hypothetical protein
MLLVALASAGAGLLACGRYGSPIRAEEYRLQEKEEARAAAERKARTSPEERNDPLPAAP